MTPDWLTIFTCIGMLAFGAVFVGLCWYHAEK